ncbi:MAG: translation elongation factor Ts [Chloroflexi bacterium]|nr:translation elongation factor Ts [Chloroflexota bacterium]
MSKITATEVKELRDITGAGFMDCKKALEEADGNQESAITILNEKGLASAAKKADRSTSEGLIVSYIHTGGRVGAMVELNCETDFVARTEDFESLGKNIAMQVAAMDPKYLDMETAEDSNEKVDSNMILLEQEYIRDSSMKISDLLKESIGKLGENIKISRFSRFELGTK